jgi:hypothetical protein
MVCCRKGDVFDLGHPSKARNNYLAKLALFPIAVVGWGR